MYNHVLVHVQRRNLLHVLLHVGCKWIITERRKRGYVEDSTFHVTGKESSSVLNTSSSTPTDGKIGACTAVSYVMAEHIALVVVPLRSGRYKKNNVILEFSDLSLRNKLCLQAQPPCTGTSRLTFALCFGKAITRGCS